MDDRKSAEISTRAPRATMGSQQTAMRVMHRKSVGIVAVYEHDPLDPGAGPRALVFESAAACTRVAEYPDNWRKLSDEELSAIRRSHA